MSLFYVLRPIIEALSLAERRRGRVCGGVERTKRIATVAKKKETPTIAKQDSVLLSKLHGIDSSKRLIRFLLIDVWFCNQTTALKYATRHE